MSICESGLSCPFLAFGEREGVVTTDIDAKKSDILKMDIEFAEFESMDGLDRDFPAEIGVDLPIGQFLVEIHLFPGRQTARGYLEW